MKTLLLLCVCGGGGGRGGGGAGMCELTGFGKFWYLLKNLGHAPA